MFKELDPLLHSHLRLAIVAALITADEAEFTWLQDQTGATAGNLSVQLNKLKDAGYIEIEKSFKGNYPQTLCRMTAFGKERFKEYVEALKEYLNLNSI
jgi:DNA-binding transcriptional ArsR family regulator